MKVLCVEVDLEVNKALEDKISMRSRRKNFEVGVERWCIYPWHCEGVVYSSKKKIRRNLREGCLH